MKRNVSPAINYMLRTLPNEALAFLSVNNNRANLFQGFY